MMHEFYSKYSCKHVLHCHFSEQKRSSAPAGQVVDITTPTEPVVKPDIPKDADSDFAELNPLDDIDVSDQLVRKKQVMYNYNVWTIIVKFK